MWRSVILAALFYLYGHPHFDGYRPSVFDRPLQGFHEEVNKITTEGQRVLENVLTLNTLTNYIARIEAKLKAD